MVTVPARLLDLDYVTVHYRDEELTVLEKEMETSLYERPSYVSTHTVSVVLRGRQRIVSEEGRALDLLPGRVGLIRRGLYTVSDLITEEGSFRAILFYFPSLAGLFPPEVGGAAGKAPREGGKASGSGLHSVNFDALPIRLDRADGVKKFLSSLTGINRLSTTPPRREMLPLLRDYYDKPLTLRDYAYLTGRSLSTFQRDFRARTGTSPRRWIIARRMERARELLADPSARVNNIALAVGYLNTSHFIKAYREAYGQTPDRSRTFRSE